MADSQPASLASAFVNDRDLSPLMPVFTQEYKRYNKENLATSMQHVRTKPQKRFDGVLNSSARSGNISSSVHCDKAGSDSSALSSESDLRARLASVATAGFCPR